MRSSYLAFAWNYNNGCQLAEPLDDCGLYLVIDEKTTAYFFDLSAIR